jgi:hypothetical protein
MLPKPRAASAERAACAVPRGKTVNNMKIKGKEIEKECMTQIQQPGETETSVSSTTCIVDGRCGGRLRSCRLSVLKPRQRGCPFSSQEAQEPK